MRLVNPRTGSVVDITDPVQITKLIYGEGYWVLGKRADDAAPLTRKPGKPTGQDQ